MKLGVIGFGNMGSAIAKGFVSKKAMDIKDIGAFDTYKKTMEKAKEDGFNIYNDELDLVKNSDAILVAVKPIHAKELFEKIAKNLKDKLIISIVAGLESATIKSWIGSDKRILRIMPNTPAIVGEGVFALDSDSNALDEEKKTVEEMFSAIGLVEWVEERLFPVVTGLSGGGPAYVAMFIEALADAGVLHGLKRDVAIKMAAKTVLGSATQLLETGIHPAVLKDMVCSPAGTTIEGVKALEDYSFRAGVIEAISAATLKSKK
ncbi:pyrroline-5-carboxylate reductase [Lachnoanaerobaculum sp. OBRC5-5]|uniref:pyrroline-5-carboxylate reductase n=1 Tax=Lachnoanaerobaculum sp. OBRC5-5 TaxID=936595 RepID=UPI0002824B7B|nr:pyrroline-5-carboxylate reductase [Lachnoanaerobaculum sp. OBRC5-5]EJZ71209.1 pyrroline-5-carboxylate reductase [Lachnoanaerobaculum sp. OBRC5-5]